MIGLVAALLLATLAVSPAAAQSAFTQGQLAELSFHQHPGAKLPLDAPLADEEGRPVRLGDFFGRKPVVLVLEYLRCKTLCGFVLDDLAKALAHVPLAAGRDYEVVAVSIDPHETAEDGRAAKARYRARYGADAGWHFLAGRESSVRSVADVVGFPYRYDAAADQFAHPAGITIAAADGTIARYVLGVDYVPLDLRLAITEAARGTISSPVTDLLLLCYCYDPANGRYNATIGTAMRIAGGITVLGILAMMVALSRTRKAR